MTKNILREITISEELTCYIQRLDYEKRSYKDITTSIITSPNNLQYNKEIYDYHMDKYIKINSEYNLAINELIQTYAKDLCSNHKLYPNIDYLTNTVQFIEATGCDCKNEN